MVNADQMKAFQASKGLHGVDMHAVHSLPLTPKAPTNLAHRN